MNDDAVAVFRRLAVKQGVLLGGLTGKRSQEFDVALVAAATCLAEGRTCTEAEVNAALKAWLAGPGAMLDVDHVELRRWLVDMRLWTRDGYGRAYVRAKPPPALAGIAAALAGVDLAAEAETARTTLAAARAARRERHAGSSSHR
jgi:hypothetical protein